jgi:DNA sulfur modification protein DndB
MADIYLPALTGQFAQWRYYQLIMQVGDIVENLGTDDAPNYRVKTVEEVGVIYSRENVSRLLQRLFDPKRLNPIKQYLLKQPDKYLNNLTFAIFDGQPEWLPIDLRYAKIFERREQYFEEIAKSFGILHLTGDETIFVLDGQHRLRGLREAVKDSEELKQQDISVTLITHKDTADGIKRTRRLFSTINRHAKPVSEGENILLDEDDVSAIIVRKLIEEYQLFRNKDVIALNKTANLKKSDTDKFSTVISLWNVNETLIDHDKLYSIKLGKKYLKVRPAEDRLIDEEKERVFLFWNFFFEAFPKARGFIENAKKLKSDPRSNGGPFYLRPIGQEVIANLYKILHETGNVKKLKSIPKIKEELNSDFWKFVLWDPYKSKMLNNKSYASNYLFYHFGVSLSKNKLSALTRNYKKNSGEQEKELPHPEFS